MFFHNFKYTLKTLLKNKPLVFWTFVFPLLLGLFFNMAFSNIENGEKFEPINIAVIENKDYKNNTAFKIAIDNLSNNKDQQIFDTKYVSLNKAKSLLDSNEIIGYLIIDNSPKIVVSTNGLNETIFKNVIDEINESIKIANTLVDDKIKKEINSGNISINYEKIYEEAINTIETNDANIKNISHSNLSYMVIEFYTLIAMTCLYGGIIGLEAMNQSLANMSNKGKRIQVSPIKKSKIILSSLLASYIVQLIGIFLLLVFLTFVLKIDFGNNILLCILLCMIGSLAGLSLGVFIGTVFKINESTKIGVIIAISMTYCFFAGMMGVTMKYVIDKNLSILNKLNPGAMITDAFYSLYYYNTLDRYIFNIIGLIIFSIILLIISSLSLRRQKYDSI